MKTLKTYLFIFIIGSLFLGCKKYPENKLWFKDPKKVFKGGKITSYTMNGLDRMKYFRDRYSTFPYNQYGKKIDNVFEIPFEYHSGEEEISTEYGKGSLHFSETKREIEITFKPLNEEYGAENIFVSRGVTWKIMKLTKDGVLKLQGKYNFITYEIQFN
jgi:hypothetical protein